MEIKQIKNIKSEVVTDIICDCCGKSCKTKEGVIDNELRIDNFDDYYDFEFMELKAYWGYSSESDGEKWTAHICEKCAKEKLSFINFNKEKRNLL